MEKGLITDKLFVKRSAELAVFILSFAVLLFSLSSCGSGNDDGLYDYIFSEIEDELSSADTAYLCYRVIVASDCTAEVYAAAEKLCSDISDSTGQTTELLYDTDDSDADDTVCEILIGNTERAESQSFLKKYRVKDFGYLRRGSVVLVGGLTSEATLSAIRSFTENIVVYADGEYFMGDGASFSYKGEYPIEKIVLRGFELCDYTLVYGDDDRSAYLEAERVREALAERSGYYLQIKSDAECSDKTRAICIGKTDINHSDGIICALNEAYILPYSTGISLLYANSYGMEYASDILLDVLCSADESGVADITIDRLQTFTFETCGFSMMSFRTDSAEYSMQDVLDIFERIDEENPEIVRLYGFSESFAEYIAESADGKYQTLTICDGIYHLYSHAAYTADIADETTFGGGSVFKTVYTNKADGISFELLEIFSDDPSDVGAAALAAAAADRMASDSECGTIIIASPFLGSADTVFSASLDRADRLSDLLDEPETDSETWIFMAGNAFDVKECEVYSDTFALYCEAELTLYGKLGVS